MTGHLYTDPDNNMPMPPSSTKGCYPPTPTSDSCCKPKPSEGCVSTPDSLAGKAVGEGEMTVSDHCQPTEADVSVGSKPQDATASAKVACGSTCCKSATPAAALKPCSSPDTVKTTATPPEDCKSNDAVLKVSSCCAPKPQAVTVLAEEEVLATKVTPASSCCQPKSTVSIAVEAVKKGCCEPKSQDLDNVETKSVDYADEEDDDTLCPCCVDVIIQRPFDILPSQDQPARSPTPNSLPAKIIDGISYSLRTCCTRLEKLCAGKACCYIPTKRQSRTWDRVQAAKKGGCCAKSDAKPEVVRGMGMGVGLCGEKRSGGTGGCSPEVPKTCCAGETPSVTEKSGLEDASPTPTMDKLQPLLLRISGMDCADCGGKVNKALARLPGIEARGLDYLNASCEVAFDPDVISSEAIRLYVARATGFGVTAVLKAEPGRVEATRMLPLTFKQMPPMEMLADYDIETKVTGKGAKNVVNLTFPTQGPGAKLPRDIIKEFEPYGVELSAVTSAAEETVKSDLVLIATRTLICGILTVPVLVLTWAQLPPRPILYSSICFGLATVVQGLAWPIISASLRSIIYLHEADLSVLVSISTLTAWIFSVVAYAFLVMGRPFAEPFFQTVTLLITLIYVGRTIQAATRRSAGGAIRRLQALQNLTVLLVEEKDGVAAVETIDARLLHYGDIIRIQPATLVPTDGIVITGHSDVDESSATGESVPVSKSPGASVRAGTLNLDGVLDVQIISLIHENSLSKVTALVNQAQASRSRFQDLADRLSAVILPVATSAALISFLVWLLVNRLGRNLSWADAAVNAITYAISIMAVSCPCALGLAVPLVVSIVMQTSLREGVFFRSGEALQRAHAIDVVAFDKTGTLSQGSLVVQRSFIITDEIIPIILAMSSTNNHPVSVAVTANLQAQMDASFEGPTLAGLTVIPGGGLQATLRGYSILAGSAKFAGVLDHPTVEEFMAEGLTVFAITFGKQLVAAFGLSDHARPGSKALVKHLTEQGKKVIMLSGDHARAVRSFAETIGLPFEATTASCTPEQKADIIASYQETGLKVCFIGDGTNDSIALSTADISLSLVSGSDIAKSSSGAVLLGTDLHRSVLSALSAADVCHLHIVAAIGWCVFYAVAAILFSAGAFVKVRIEPQWAGLGEVVSVLPVVAIAFAVPVTWGLRKGKWSKP